MELWGDKIIALFLMGTLTASAGLVPIWLLQHFRSTLTNKNSRKKLDQVLSLLNCFVGGVFLATTLVHMLPEAREATEIYLADYEIEIEFPITEFTVCMGVFIVMVLEHIVMVCRHQPDQEEHKESHRGDEEQIIHKASPIATVEQLSMSHSTDIKMTTEAVGNIQEGSDERVRSRSLSRAGSLVMEGSFQISERRGSHSHHHVSESDLASLRSFVLLLAISIHTVFEGLAIGLQDSANTVWNLFLAIIIHKVIIAFSLGLQFAEHLKRKSKAILFMSIFAVLSPIGIAVGTAITAAGSGESMEADVVTGILQCIATGTLLYVSFFEVLMGEIGNDHSLLKVLLVILGFTLMSLLSLFNHE